VLATPARRQALAVLVLYTDSAFRIPYPLAIANHGNAYAFPWAFAEGMGFGHESLSKIFRKLIFVLSARYPSSSTSTRCARLVYRLRFSNPIPSRNSKPRKCIRIPVGFGGGYGIRTHEGVTPTSLAVRRFRPLSQPSMSWYRTTGAQFSPPCTFRYVGPVPKPHFPHITRRMAGYPHPSQRDFACVV
jgi:hypothetical protein